MTRSTFSRWVLVLTLSGYPIVAGLSETLGLPNRAMSIALRASVLLMALIVLARGWRQHLQQASPWFWLPWLAFWALYLPRIAIDLFLNPQALKLPLLEYVTFGIGVSLLPAWAMAAADPRKATARAPDLLIVVTSIGMLLNLWAIFFQGGLLATFRPDALRIETETLNPITIGHMGVSVLLLCHWQFVAAPRRPWPYRTALVLLAMLSVLGILASGSRGPIVSLAFGLLALVWWRPTVLMSPWTLVAAAAMAVAAALVIDDLSSLFLFERLADSAFEDSAREQLMGDGLRAFLDNPFIGAGIDPLETYPHNLVLESFMAFGLLSGLAFCTLLSYATLQSLRLARLQPECFWVTLLYLQYMMSAMVSGSLYGSSALWVLMVLVIALAESAQQSGPKGLGSTPAPLHCATDGP